MRKYKGKKALALVWTALFRLNKVEISPYDCLLSPAMAKGGIRVELLRKAVIRVGGDGQAVLIGTRRYQGCGWSRGR